MSILPGGTIGILGGGQLGRMLTLAAKRLGYQVHIFSPDADTPAGQVADAEITAAYTDTEALSRFARNVDIVTIEFENIPVTALKAVEAHVPVYPQPHVLEIAQNRSREKAFLAELGIPTAQFKTIITAEELTAAVAEIGCPAVLKTAGFGYDGKGQSKLTSPEQALPAFEALNRTACTLEQFVDLEREISVIAARGVNGEFATYRPVENSHHNHILDITLAPAAISPELETQALDITRTIMEKLNMCGLLCVEFFVCKDGRLLVNELAPRTHNSGHYSIEATTCSQFEQQLRAVCGLPLGETQLHHAAAMANLLGDLWQNGEPDWVACLAEGPVSLHLYGKKEARPGRKMGHLTVLGNTPQEAQALALQARSVLMQPLRASQPSSI
jgi:5-(carboxyamino)imidazole ribonucleotide synthase